MKLCIASTVTGVTTVMMVCNLGAAPQVASPGTTQCNVTAPNGVVAGETERQNRSYGNALLSVGPFGLWPDGTIVFKPGGAGLVLPDGALSMKIGWTRAVPGTLKIWGRRLDSEAQPLRSNIPCCYEETGFKRAR